MSVVGLYNPDTFNGAYTAPTLPLFPPQVMQAPYGFITQADASTLTTNQNTAAGPTAGNLVGGGNAMKLSQLFPNPPAEGMQVYVLKNGQWVISSFDPRLVSQWLPVDIEVFEGELVRAGGQDFRLVGGTLVPAQTGAPTTASALGGGGTIGVLVLGALALWYFIGRKK